MYPTTIIAIEQGKYAPSLELAFRIARGFRGKRRGLLSIRGEQITKGQHSTVRYVVNQPTQNLQADNGSEFALEFERAITKLDIQRYF